eukprot:TRINITY_DN8888_c0_g1_i1.p1 TRINITY_DN8888_c0_g1~~TRINITY_DN8888_c0_g1_i1.p1  ORF type:complete len:789 (-),score=155.87 TRINITY_DN8888_c0_g1_i1:680-3046(-)
MRMVRSVPLSIFLLRIALGLLFALNAALFLYEWTTPPSPSPSSSPSSSSLTNDALSHAAVHNYADELSSADGVFIRAHPPQEDSAEVRALARRMSLDQDDGLSQGQGPNIPQNIPVDDRPNPNLAAPANNEQGPDGNPNQPFDKPVGGNADSLPNHEFQDQDQDPDRQNPHQPTSIGMPSFAPTHHAELHLETVTNHSIQARLTALGLRPSCVAACHAMPRVFFPLPASISCSPSARCYAQVISYTGEIDPSVVLRPPSTSAHTDASVLSWHSPSLQPLQQQLQAQQQAQHRRHRHPDYIQQQQQQQQQQAAPIDEPLFEGDLLLQNQRAIGRNASLVRFHTADELNTDFLAKNTVNCTSPVMAQCEVPLLDYCVQNPGITFLRANVDLDLPAMQLHASYIFANTPRRDSFVIHSIMQHQRQGFVVVISSYLPMFSNPDRCNTMYCIYDHGSDTPLEQFPLVQGDYSFGICPKPKNPTKHTKLLLAYDSRFFSLPKPYAVDKVINNIPFAHMAACTVAHMQSNRIVEWIEYHILMGFRRFIIYDTSPKEDPDPFISLVAKSYPFIVIRVHWPHPFAKAQAMTDCIRRYGAFSRWMTILGIGDYFVPALPYSNIRDILTTNYTLKRSLLPKVTVFGACDVQSTKPIASLVDLCRTYLPQYQNLQVSIFQPAYATGVHGNSLSKVTLHSNSKKDEVASIPHQVDEHFHIFRYEYGTLSDFLHRSGWYLGSHIPSSINETQLELIWNAAKSVHTLPKNYFYDIQRFNSILSKRTEQRLQRIESQRVASAAH